MLSKPMRLALLMWVLVAVFMFGLFRASSARPSVASERRSFEEQVARSVPVAVTRAELSEDAVAQLLTHGPGLEGDGDALNWSKISDNAQRDVSSVLASIEIVPTRWGGRGQREPVRWFASGSSSIALLLENPLNEGQWMILVQEQSFVWVIGGVGSGIPADRVFRLGVKGDASASVFETLKAALDRDISGSTADLSTDNP